MWYLMLLSALTLLYGTAYVVQSFRRKKRGQACVMLFPLVTLLLLMWVTITRYLPTT